MEARVEWYKILDAATEGKFEGELEELQRKGVDLNIQLEFSVGLTSVLHLLVQRGDTAGTELLIAKGASIHMTRGKEALTALHIAAYFGRAELVEILIKHGANVQARSSERPDGSWSMPLHLVAEFGNDSPSYVQILKHLLNPAHAATDFCSPDADGNTPLHCAALNATHSHTMIEELLSILNMGPGGKSSVVNLQNPKVVDLQNHKRQTALHFAVGNGNLEAANLLLGAGATKDACDVYGATPFHYAARSGNVRRFLSIFNVTDATVNAAADKNEFTALHYAAWNKRHDTVRLLLDHGASVNVIDGYKGDTPLHLAARRGDAQVIETLIKKGEADILLTNKKGELALGLADDRGYHEAARAFVKAIAKQDLLHKRQDLLEKLWTQHHHNGASLLHYFAAYGTENDMEWILKVMSASEHTAAKWAFENHRRNGGGVNALDNRQRNAVHWAVMKGNTHTLRILAKNNADLNAEGEAGQVHKTPLYLALMHEKIPCANELMKLKSEYPTLQAQDWLRDIRQWMKDYYAEHENELQMKLSSLRSHPYSWHYMQRENKKLYPPSISNETLFSEIPPVFLALYAEREDIAVFIQQHSKGGDDAVNKTGDDSGRTSLHWATLLGQKEIVAQLCRIKVFKDNLIANVEDKCRKTALQYAKEILLEGAGDKKNDFEDIEKELMQRSDVRAHIHGLYKDRQVYVYAANAILVGAVLIAGVAFAGWLQPPLGYADYYNLPKLSTPLGAADAFQSYAAIQQHAGVRGFWVLNGLSFCFAIASVLAGLVAVVPIPGVYIATSVAHIRRCLPIAAALLGSSIACVLGAFAAAGFAVLPPLFKYQAFMLATTIVGAMPSALLFIWFWRRFSFLIPEWLTVKNQTCCSAAAPAQIVIVVDSSTPVTQASTSENAGADDDYKVGEKYPWDDGLNVPPL